MAEARENVRESKIKGSINGNEHHKADAKKISIKYSLSSSNKLIFSKRALPPGHYLPALFRPENPRKHIIGFMTALILVA